MNTTPNTADQLRRLQQVEHAYQEWSEKTEWVQQTATAQELGMHRADVLKARIERLQAENDTLRTEMAAIGAGGVEPLRQRHDHIEGSLEMAARQALEAMHFYMTAWNGGEVAWFRECYKAEDKVCAAITALREALEAAPQRAHGIGSKT